MKEHPSWSEADASAVVHSVWNRRHKNFAGYELFTDEAVIISEKPQTPIENAEDDEPHENRRMVAIIGDRFMNGGFFPFSELKKCYKQWENTLHDINHMGTSTGFFLLQQDITYFVAFHKNVKLNAASKEVSMDIIPEKSTHYHDAWKGFLALCDKAGMIPNVSVTYYGKRKFIPASDLPKGIDWKKEGYGKDDLVPVLYNVVPVCVSTVFMGRCSDKDGCGIKNIDACDCQKHDNENENFKKAYEEQIERIKQKLKKLN